MKDEANIRGGFDGTLVPGNRPALLVIDFQRGFTEAAISPLASDCSSAIAATNRLIVAMRGLGPVIFTVVGYSANMADIGCWKKNAARSLRWKGEQPLVSLIPDSTMPHRPT